MGGNNLMGVVVPKEQFNKILYMQVIVIQIDSSGRFGKKGCGAGVFSTVIPHEKAYSHFVAQPA